MRREVDEFYGGVQSDDFSQPSSRSRSQGSARSPGTPVTQVDTYFLDQWREQRSKWGGRQIPDPGPAAMRRAIFKKILQDYDVEQTKHLIDHFFRLVEVNDLPAVRHAKTLAGAFASSRGRLRPIPKSESLYEILKARRVRI